MTILSLQNKVKLDLMQKGSGRPREDQLEYEVIEIESDAT
jgi:hypothetical protein